MPSHNEFTTTLIEEKDKNVQMNSLKPSKAHSLTTNQGTKESLNASKNNKQKHNNRDINDKGNGNKFKYTCETSHSKDEKTKSKKVKCAYCNNHRNIEHKCMRKKLNNLNHILEHNNIKVHDYVKVRVHQLKSIPRNKRKKGKEIIIHRHL